MATPVNDSIFVRSKKDIDDKRGVFENGVFRPYNSKAEVFQKINAAYMYPTLTVNITVNGKPVEHWFEGNIFDEAHLIPKLPDIQPVSQTEERTFILTIDDFESDGITYRNEELSYYSWMIVEYIGVSVLEPMLDYVPISSKPFGFQLNPDEIGFGPGDKIRFTGWFGGQGEEPGPDPGDELEFLYDDTILTDVIKLK